LARHDDVVAQRRTTMTQSKIPMLTMLVALLGASSPATGQIIMAYRGTDVGGLQPAHGVFSFEPFEHLDTSTGTIVLAFADYVLPGNAGRDLVIQRTYHNPEASPHFHAASRLKVRT
jgi:hypothetical protein